MAKKYPIESHLWLDFEKRRKKDVLIRKFVTHAEKRLLRGNSFVFFLTCQEKPILQHSKKSELLVLLSTFTWKKTAVANAFLETVTASWITAITE